MNLCKKQTAFGFSEKVTFSVFPTHFFIEKLNLEDGIRFNPPTKDGVTRNSSAVVWYIVHRVCMLQHAAYFYIR